MITEMDEMYEIERQKAIADAMFYGERFAVPIAERAAEIRRIAEEERADLEAWFADDGTPAADHQT